MEVEGKLKVVFDAQTFASGFQKREFVITTHEQYPQDLKFELIKDRVDLINAYKPGSELKVYFNLRGNEYNGKYFVNLQAWKIEAGGKPQQQGNLPQEEDFEPIPSKDDGFADAVEDDLPF